MLTVAASISTQTIQPPIVNTTTPGTTVNHVPYDNVAPSVSSAQVDNHTKGNGTATQAAAEQAAAPPPDSGDEGASFALRQNRLPSLPSIAAQSGFVAQLAGQDTSPQTQGILLQYEKLVSYSDVKYKPSNAARPQAGPASLFGQIVQAEQAAPAQPTSAPPPVAAAPPPAPAAATVAVANTALTAETRPVQRAAKAPDSAPVDAASPTEGSTESAPVEQAASRPPQAITAYLATASRVASFSTDADAPPTVELA